MKILQKITQLKNRVFPSLMPDNEKKKLSFTYKLLSTEQTRFRNGSYNAFIKIKDVEFLSSTNIVVNVDVTLIKRRGSKNIERWKKDRINKLTNILRKRYEKKLKFIGVTSLKLKLFDTNST